MPSVLTNEAWSGQIKLRFPFGRHIRGQPLWSAKARFRFSR